MRGLRRASPARPQPKKPLDGISRYDRETFMLTLSARRRSLSVGSLAVVAACVVWACGGDEDVPFAETTSGGSGQGQAAQGGTSGGGGTTTGGVGGTAAGTMGAAGEIGQAGAAPGQGGVGGETGEGGGGAGAMDGGGAAGEATGGTGQGGTGQGGVAGGGVAGAAGAAGQGTSGAAGKGGGAGGKGGGAAGKDGGDPIDPKSTVEMLFTTANIGREYKTKADVAAVFDKIGDLLDDKQMPRFVGWQEIGEGDPCGDTCEREALTARFQMGDGWFTEIPKGKLPGGGTDVVHVPVTSRGAGGDSAVVRAIFSQPGWEKVSPARFVTVVYYPDRNASLVNTHFIASAWNCSDNTPQRREYWQKTWTVLKEEVAKEHDKGRNVVITGDFNRMRATSSCNPKWDPESVHPAARIIGGAGIDYIFAVPAGDYKFALSKKGDGSTKAGEIVLGIDGHKAHWVAGQFLAKLRALPRVFVGVGRAPLVSAATARAVNPGESRRRRVRWRYRFLCRHDLDPPSSRRRPFPLFPGCCHRRGGARLLRSRLCR
jgi:hypothetical protein